MISTIVKNPADIEALESKPSFLAAIIQRSDDAILGMTLEGIIRTWNKGVSNEEFIERVKKIIEKRKQD